LIKILTVDELRAKIGFEPLTKQDSNDTTQPSDGDPA
jgi:hypothetical protein